MVAAPAAAAANAAAAAQLRRPSNKGGACSSLGKNNDFFSEFRTKIRKSSMNFCEYFELGEVRRCVNLIDLEKG